MKNAIRGALFVGAVLMVFSCKNSRFGELYDTRSGKKWMESTPYGMSHIRAGFFKMGGNDQSLGVSDNPPKTVSIDAFWMDDTEVTNNEYRQFVSWVKEKMARELLAEQYPEFLISEDKKGNPVEPPLINWDEKIDWKDPGVQTALDDLYIPEEERFFGQKGMDARKLVYEYWWLDLKQAAKSSNRYNYKTLKYEGNVYNADGKLVPVKNHSSFIRHRVVHIYPDTLCWIRDFTYSYNEPRTKQYFCHPAFSNYPVVGVTWEQAKAFCHWRTQVKNNYLAKHNEELVQDYRLPTEAEWEYAARGKRNVSVYPWGSYYTQNEKGDFYANFKPYRGDYVSDGGMATLEAGSYEPNDLGLYDMAGNVAEWTSNAYDAASYSFVNDFNPNYEYDARPDDPPVMKRKVIRGGSWKDISQFIQVSTRDFEYQDSTKSYIGFRCVRSTFGKDF